MSDPISPATDAALIRRAIALAAQGRGNVEPNPLVGCLLVRDGVVIGEGYHAQFGGPHAEPAALADCAARGHSPRGATAYVTLEPCCHTNKKTPPCAPRLIEAGIARVVIGCLDPNPAVNGNGVAQLRQAGIEVTVGVLEAEARQLIALFILASRRRRPYVTLKWAETFDHKIAGAAGRRLQISGPESQRLVHELRSRCDGILVGVGTVLIDDPLLTARLASSPSHPPRFVLDSRLRTPPTAKLVTDDSASTTVLYARQTDPAHRRRRDQLEAAGVTTIMLVPDAVGRPRIEDVLQHLRSAGVTDLLVEPGRTLAQSFFDSGAVDRVWRFSAPTRSDDPSAPTAAEVPEHYIPVAEVKVGDDRMTEYLNPKSEAFFAALASVDVGVVSSTQ